MCGRRRLGGGRRVGGVVLVDEDDKEYYEGRYGTGVGFETWFCSWVGWG